MKYITFSISIVVISWGVGMIITALIQNSFFYTKVSNFNFIKSKAFNKVLGLKYFKWIVKNTFFKYLNQKLTLKNKIDKADLITLRKEMTYAEISHLVGFVFASVFVVIKIVKGDYLFGLVIMLVNILMNIYPTLLQQLNKRRIDIFLRRMDR